MFTTIMSGRTTLADVLFLIAVILIAIELLIRLGKIAVPVDNFLVAAAIGCIAFGLLAL